MSDIELLPAATEALIAGTEARLSELGVRGHWKNGSLVDEQAASGALEVRAGTQAHEFPAIASPTVNTASLTLLPHDARTILLTRHVSEPRSRAIKDRGWAGFVDLAGNASLRAPGLVIEISGRRDPGVERATASAAPFTRAGLPVTLALLVMDQEEGTIVQRDLAAASGASVGTVNRVVRALRDRTPAMLDGGNHLLRPTALETEWISAYSALQPRAWPEERFTSDLWKTPDDLLKATLPSGAVLGSELGAAQLGAPIRPSTALVHLSPDARQDFIRGGRLRRAEDGLIRVRPAPWRVPPPGREHIAPAPLLRADLLLEDDPRLDEIEAHFLRDAR